MLLYQVVKSSCHQTIGIIISTRIQLSNMDGGDEGRGLITHRVKRVVPQSFKHFTRKLYNGAIRLRSFKIGQLTCFDSLREDPSQLVHCTGLLGGAIYDH